MRAAAFLVLLGLGGVALANPKVIEIKVPEPSKAPPPPPPPSPLPAEAPQGVDAEGNAAGGTPPVDAAAVQAGRSAARREPREVKGEPPQVLWGRYTVVQVTRAGETEDFRIKMDREARALKQDCITDQLVFEFGQGAEPLPATVTIAEQQLCTKGGLGSYANELGLEMPAVWQADGGALKLSLPPVEATATLVRVRPPTDNDDLNTPSHWMGPVTEVERGRADFQVLAEYGKPRPGAKSKAQQAEPARPAVVHLVAKDVVYHLEPEPDGGLFYVPSPAHPAHTQDAGTGRVAP